MSHKHEGTPSREINEDYMREMNAYFNHLKKCDLKHPHHEGECCYIGTIGERWEKYKEIEKRELTKKAKDAVMPLLPPQLIRSKAIYIDKSNPKNNLHPFEHLL